MIYLINVVAGCAYRLNEGVLEFAPLNINNTFDDQEFATVEFDILDEPILTEARESELTRLAQEA